MDILKTPGSNLKTVFPGRGTENYNSLITYSMIQVFFDSYNFIIDAAGSFEMSVTLPVDTCYN
jgi:hypothetical protein